MGCSFPSSSTRNSLWSSWLSSCFLLSRTVKYTETRSTLFLITLSWPAASCAQPVADMPMVIIEKARTRRDTSIARCMGRSSKEGIAQLDAAIPPRGFAHHGGYSRVWSLSNPQASAKRQLRCLVQENSYSDNRAIQSLPEQS